MHDRQVQREWIATLCSFVVHLAVLLVLAVWTARAGLVGRSLVIDSGIAETSELEAFEIAPASAPVEQALAAQEDASLPSTALAPGMPIPDIASPEIDLASTAALESQQLVDLRLPEGGGNLGFAESSLDGRSDANRKRLAMQNGGNAESERAVELALEYLALHQSNDGSWSMNFEAACDGACRPGCSGLDPHRFAATGLALLCFLGAGKTDADEKFGTAVSKGIYFLQQNLRTNSASGFWVGTEAGAQMYEHGIATLALCEAYQMTGANELKESCQLAINFIVEAQFQDGGWDYHPGSPGDLSIAGWQVMALKSAVASKLAVPRRTLSSIDRFLDSCRGGEFMYRYRSRKPTASMTAIGMLLQIFRGKSGELRSIQLAAEYLMKEGPSDSDLYYDYYATMGLFQLGQMGSPVWNQWNPRMRDYLIRTQVANGHSAGSWWYQGDPWNEAGGRLYSTCMGCLILEVYYRYLPVYGRAEQEFQF